MAFNKQAHVTYKTRYHLVWIPKYRRKVLNKGIGKYFEKTLKTFLAERYPDILVLEQSVQIDHVHLYLQIPPKYSVSTIVGRIKAHTARILRKKFNYLKSIKSLWSVGYFVTTVGANETVIKNYIRRQEKEDEGRSEIVLEETMGVA